jgi:hypothetical protein
VPASYTGWLRFFMCHGFSILNFNKNPIRGSNQASLLLTRLCRMWIFVSRKLSGYSGARTNIFAKGILPRLGPDFAGNETRSEASGISAEAS